MLLTAGSCAGFCSREGSSTTITSVFVFFLTDTAIFVCTAFEIASSKLDTVLRWGHVIGFYNSVLIWASRCPSCFDSFVLSHAGAQCFFQWLAISVDSVSRSWLFSRNVGVKKKEENVFKQWLFPVVTDDGNLTLLSITEKRTDIWTSDNFKKGDQECTQMHTNMYIFAYNVIFKNNSSFSFSSYLPPLPMGVPSVPVCRLQANQQICLCPWKSLKHSPVLQLSLKRSCLNPCGVALESGG